MLSPSRSQSVRPRIREDPCLASTPIRAFPAGSRERAVTGRGPGPGSRTVLKGLPTDTTTGGSARGAAHETGGEATLARNYHLANTRIWR